VWLLSIATQQPTCIIYHLSLYLIITHHHHCLMLLLEHYEVDAAFPEAPKDSSSVKLNALDYTATHNIDHF
jgi:hypothetical protein